MPDSTVIKFPRKFYWKLWAYTIAFTVFLQFMQRGHVGNGISATVALVASFLTFVLAVIFRWVVIPRIKDEMKRCMTVAFGMALGESISFYGIFFLPPDMAHLRGALFIASLLSILQFAPFYMAKRSHAETC